MISPDRNSKNGITFLTAPDNWFMRKFENRIPTTNTIENVWAPVPKGGT